MSIFSDWEFAKPHIEAALAYSKGTHTLDDVAIMVGAGMLSLVVGRGCAMLTEVQNYPRIRVLNVFAAGGDLAGLLELENGLLNLAKEKGCQRVTETGRKGWLRTLPGAKELGTALYRDVS